MFVFSVSGLVCFSALNAQPPVEYYYPNKPKVEAKPKVESPQPAVMPAPGPLVQVRPITMAPPPVSSGGSSDGSIYVGKRMADGSIVVSVGGSTGGYPYPSYSGPSSYPSSYGSSYYGGGSYYPGQPLREPVYGSRDFDVQYRNYIAQTDYLNSIYRSSGSYGVPSYGYGGSRPVTSYSGPSYPVGPVYSSGSFPQSVPYGGTVIRR